MTQILNIPINKINTHIQTERNRKEHKLTFCHSELNRLAWVQCRRDVDPTPEQSWVRPGQICDGHRKLSLPLIFDPVSASLSSEPVSFNEYVLFFTFILAEEQIEESSWRKRASNSDTSSFSFTTNSDSWIGKSSVSFTHCCWKG